MVLGFHGCTGGGVVVVGLPCFCGLFIAASETVLEIGIVIRVSMVCDCRDGFSGVKVGGCAIFVVGDLQILWRNEGRSGCPYWGRVLS